MEGFSNAAPGWADIQCVFLELSKSEKCVLEVTDPLQWQSQIEIFAIKLVK